jgi:hypothetical protein
MKRLLIAALFALVLTNASSAPAFAFRETEWCEFDPLLIVDGHRSDVTLLMPLQYRSTLTAPVSFVFHVEPGSHAHATYPKSQGPLNVQIRYDGKEDVVTVDAWVTSKAFFPTKTVVLRPHMPTIEKLGTSQHPTHITYTLPDD